MLSLTLSSSLAMLFDDWIIIDEENWEAIKPSPFSSAALRATYRNCLPATLKIIWRWRTNDETESCSHIWRHRMHFQRGWLDVSSPNPNFISVLSFEWFMAEIWARSRETHVVWENWNINQLAIDFTREKKHLLNCFSAYKSPCNLTPNCCLLATREETQQTTTTTTSLSTTNNCSELDVSTTIFFWRRRKHEKLSHIWSWHKSPMSHSFHSLFFSFFMAPTLNPQSSLL